MNLIGYSDSDDSDNDAPQPPKPVAKPVAKSASKPAFQKIVDRSNPGKINIQLPAASHSRQEKDDIEADAPPAKKARTGGSAFSGFNSFLPAPKKPILNAIWAESAGSEQAPPGSRGLGKRMGQGINLKTGAEPSFRRKADDYDEDGNPTNNPVKQGDGKALQKEDFRAMLNLPASKPQPKETKPEVIAAPAEPTTKPKPRFLPLSVARGKKPLRKRPADTTSGASKTAAAPQNNAPQVDTKPPAKPKISLFSVTPDDDPLPTTSAPGETYQPLLYGADEDNESKAPDDAFNDQAAYTNTSQYPPPSTSASAAHDLNNIASELNLSEAERRQLFGRKGQGPDLSGANVIEFNTDTEYAHNEKLRQQGETVKHNALKSISGTGKNSLKSLINVAVTQKDALEEHFAAGYRNKKEAGNRYGW